MTPCFRYYDIPTKPLSRMTTLSRFPAKMTLVHAGALLGLCLFACISDGPSMRAWQVSKGKRKCGKAMMRIRAKHFLVPSRS